MLVELLKAELNKLHIRRWLLLYFITLIIAVIVAIIFFRGSSYPVDQIALVIAMPVVIAIASRGIYRYLTSWLRGGTAARETSKPQETKGLEVVLLVLSVISMLIFIASLGFALLMSASSGVYLLLGLEWATKVAWSKIAIYSFHLAGYSLACLVVFIIAFITRPYWLSFIRITRERLAVWRESSKDLHIINGYKLPLHR